MKISLQNPVTQNSERLKNHFGTITRLSHATSELTRTSLLYLEKHYGWFRSLPKQQRNTVKSVVHLGLKSFVNWMERPSSPSISLISTFGIVPAELTHDLKLDQVIQICNGVSTVLEHRVHLLCPEDPEWLQSHIMTFSREAVFAAADAFLRARETSGSWDPALESSVMDSILRGDSSDGLMMKLHSLGWRQENKVAVVMGNVASNCGRALSEHIRRTAAEQSSQALVHLQGRRLSILLGGFLNVKDVVENLLDYFDEGPVVFGPVVKGTAEAHDSAQAAFSGFMVARAWSQAPSPVGADELLPERIYVGDRQAKNTLIKQIYRPLLTAAPTVLSTLEQYLECGGSLEATARALKIHTNTVRYRLRRVPDLTGWDPFVPREARTLRAALTAGKLERNP